MLHNVPYIELARFSLATGPGLWLSAGSCWLLGNCQYLSAGEPRVGPSVPQPWLPAGLMHPPMQSYKADFARPGAGSPKTLQEPGRRST